MTQQEVMGFLNDVPYFYYYTLAEGVVLAEQADGREIRISRNKEEGCLDAACGENIFHFEWEDKKWRPKKRQPMPVLE